MANLTPADRIKNEKDSVWVEFIDLALKHKPLNLGQGFPDYAAPPNEVTKALANAALSDNILLNQYTRGFGHPRLVNAIGKLYSKLCNREISPMTEVLVTIGAYEALFCAFQAWVNPGDEVIIIEPFFDCYEPMVRQAGGIPVFVPLVLREEAKNKSTLSSADLVLDEKELASKFNSKTKMIVVNTPSNPHGKVFTRAELEFIGGLCKKHNVIALMDEVYEWIVYDGLEHVRMASLPGMWESTITVGSAGKTFSATGWKLGWSGGPAHLIKPMMMVHQNTVYTCSTTIQEAVAVGFENELARLGTNDSYWKQLSESLQVKRDKMVKFLTEAGMKPIIPQGGYFMLADYTKLASKLGDAIDQEKPGATRDYKFVYYMTKNKGIQGIPPSAFYSEEHKHLGENFVRYCFMKKDETLDEAERILMKVKN